MTEQFDLQHPLLARRWGAKHSLSLHSLGTDWVRDSKCVFCLRLNLKDLMLHSRNQWPAIRHVRKMCCWKTRVYILSIECNNSFAPFFVSVVEAERSCKHPTNIMRLWVGTIVSQIFCGQLLSCFLKKHCGRPSWLEICWHLSHLPLKKTFFDNDFLQWASKRPGWKDGHSLVSSVCTLWTPRSSWLQVKTKHWSSDASTHSDTVPFKPS